MATPIVISWDFEDSRMSHFDHSPVNLVSATDAADNATANMADHPLGQRALGFQNITTHFGLSGVQDWPQWCIDKLDVSGAFLSGAETYMTTYFARINTNGVLPDYIVLDEEGGVGIQSVFPATGSTSQTVAITAASWSSGVASLTLGSAYSAVDDQDLIVDGVTPGGYNGKFSIASRPDTTHLTYNVDTDPGGVGTLFGSIYLALDAREHFYQMVLDDASALAKVPALRVQGQVTASDFATGASNTIASNTWNPWVRMLYGEQLSLCVVDVASTQLGYTPRVSNFNDMAYHFTDTITGPFSEAVTSYRMGDHSAPRCYLDSSSGSKYSGSDKDKNYQRVLDLINTVSSCLRSNSGPVRPWVSYATGAPDFELFKAFIRICWEMGCDGFYLFNPSATVGKTSELFFVELPAIKQVRIQPSTFDPATMPTVTVGTVTFDRNDMEDIL